MNSLLNFFFRRRTFLEIFVYSILLKASLESHIRACISKKHGKWILIMEGNYPSKGLMHDYLNVLTIGKEKWLCACMHACRERQ